MEAYIRQTSISEGRLTSQNVHRINDERDASLAQTVGPVDGQHDTAEIVVVRAHVGGESASHGTASKYRHQTALIGVKHLLTSLTLSPQNLKIK